MKIEYKIKVALSCVLFVILSFTILLNLVYSDGRLVTYLSGAVEMCFELLYLLGIWLDQPILLCISSVTHGIVAAFYLTTVASIWVQYGECVASKAKDANLCYFSAVSKYVI